MILICKGQSAIGVLSLFVLINISWVSLKLKNQVPPEKLLEKMIFKKITYEDEKKKQFTATFTKITLYKQSSTAFFSNTQ